MVQLLSFSFTSIITPNAESINYVHDGMNRLIRVYYGDGKVIEYNYDNAGNRVSKTISQITDSTPPTTTAFPAGGIFASAQSVSLGCSDSTGFGCSKIYYTTDGSTPTPASTTYRSPIHISANTTLKYFAKDLVGNSEPVKTENYSIDTYAPTGTIYFNSGTSSTNQVNVVLNLFCQDALGCSHMQFSIDDITYSIPEAFAPTGCSTRHPETASRTYM